jgi:hypothetical protein
MALWDLFCEHRGRKIHKWTHYFPIYERHFGQFVNRDITVLEIGLGRGGSLELWHKYFGPQARIVGIDIMPGCLEYETKEIKVRIGSQSDLAFMSSIVEKFGVPDIVIDDGSHKPADQIASFEFLYPKMPKNSLYLLEDMHTNYWAEYDAGYRDPSTFIEYSKQFIDRINANHTRGALAPDELANNTFGMYWYDSIIVFEKMRKHPFETRIVGSD